MRCDLFSVSGKRVVSFCPVRSSLVSSSPVSFFLESFFLGLSPTRTQPSGPVKRKETLLRGSIKEKATQAYFLTHA